MRGGNKHNNNKTKSIVNRIKLPGKNVQVRMKRRRRVGRKNQMDVLALPG